MRNLLLVSLLGATACGARAPRVTLPVEYTCGDSSIVRRDDRLDVREPSATTAGLRSGAARLGWRDDAGEHFVTWPMSPTDIDAIEFVVPADPRLDATMRVYDTSTGNSTADWRLVRRDVCTARGGYNDALARYLRGESYDQVAAELQLGDRDEARDLVHRGMLALQRKYFRDR